MKKILFILLLISHVSFGQITITNGSSQASCNVTLGNGSSILSNRNLEANHLYILVSCANSVSATTFSSSDGNNWWMVDSINDGSRKIIIWAFMPTTTTTTDDLTVTYSSPFPTSVAYAFYDVANAQTGADGRNAIIQSAENSGTGADPSITLNSLNQRNAILASYFNNRDDFTGSPESGWTENNDIGCTDGAAVGGYYAMSRVNTTDNTPTVTSASSTWLGIAIELRQSGRRVTLVD